MSLYTCAVCGRMNITDTSWPRHRCDKHTVPTEADRIEQTAPILTLAQIDKAPKPVAYLLRPIA
jgi:hypothetical protein